MISAKPRSHTTSLRAAYVQVCVWLLVACLAQEAWAQSSVPNADKKPGSEPAMEGPGTTEARSAIARARDRFDRGDYEAAVLDFQRAFELLAGDPRQSLLLNNIAVCYERLFRYDLALRYYQQYLDAGPTDAADREEVARVIAGLRGLLGKLRIVSNVPAQVWVGRDIQLDAPGEAWVPAGTHVVEVSARGHESERRQVRVAPRSAQTLRFELKPAPRYEGLPRAYFYSGVALTGAALIVGAGFGLKALQQHRHASADYSRDSAQNRLLQSDNEQITRLQHGADICFATAALFGVSTLVVFFLTDWSKRREPQMEATRPSPRVRLFAHASAHEAVLGFGGRLR